VIACDHWNNFKRPWGHTRSGCPGAPLHSGSLPQGHTQFECAECATLQQGLPTGKPTGSLVWESHPIWVSRSVAKISRGASWSASTRTDALLHTTPSMCIYASPYQSGFLESWKQRAGGASLMLDRKSVNYTKFQSSPLKSRGDGARRGLGGGGVGKEPLHTHFKPFFPVPPHSASLPVTAPTGFQ